MRQIWNVTKDHKWIIYIGLSTGGAMVLAQLIKLLVIYRYLQLDYYLCGVAICFGIGGWMLSSRRSTAKPTLPGVVPAETGKDLLTVLTSKELHILRLLADSKTNQEIATESFIALSTVKTHVNNIYSKLSVSNRKEARSKYVEMTQRFPIS
jgi:DNA-binding CsgD family transcriptional regulator